LVSQHPSIAHGSQGALSTASLGEHPANADADAPIMAENADVANLAASTALSAASAMGLAGGSSLAFHVAGQATATVPDAGTGQAAAAAVPLAGLGVAIAARFSDGQRRFDIRLDPPDLGRVDVRLSVDRDGHVTSRLVAERADTLDLLRRDAPQLERALQDAGFKTADSGLQFSLRDQGFTDGSPTGRNPAPSAPSLAIPIEPPSTADASRNYVWRGGAGGLDIRV